MAKPIEPGIAATRVRAERERRRWLLFAIIVAASIAAVASYAVHVVARGKAQLAATEPVASVSLGALPGSTTLPPALPAPGPERSAHAARAMVPTPGARTPGQVQPTKPALTAAAAQSVRAAAEPPPTIRPYLLFRNTALGDGYGRVGMVYLDAVDGPRSVGSLQCDRVHFAAGTGVCLEALRSGIASYRAHVFDARFDLRHTLPLAGPPSRTRVSHDGRLAAFTVFVNGHSYSSPGFTTRTSIIDTASGRLIVGDLEALPVVKDGAPFKAADFNFWGFTFASDGNRFYTTLGTAGKVYLVEGDLASRRMRVIHDDVECPSLSPDGTRVAFKRRAAVDGAGRRIWRLVVIELATRKETLLHAETRNVDDQVEWLDNRTILYAMPKSDQQSMAGTDIWTIDADASGPPRLLLAFAFSPAVVR